MDLSEPFQIKFLPHLSPCSAAIFLCANISKFICGFFPPREKNPCFSSSHLNLLDLPHHFFYLISISCFSAQREQDITENVQTQILEIYSSDTQNIIVLLFSILKLFCQNNCITFLLYIVFLQVYFASKDGWQKQFL